MSQRHHLPTKMERDEDTALNFCVVMGLTYKGITEHGIWHDNSLHSTGLTPWAKVERFACEFCKGSGRLTLKSFDAEGPQDEECGDCDGAGFFSDPNPMLPSEADATCFAALVLDTDEAVQ